MTVTLTRSQVRELSELDRVNGQNVIIIKADSELDIDQSSPLLESIRQQGDDQATCVIVDCSSVDFLHTVGISKLVSLHIRLNKNGDRLILCELKSRLAEMFQTLRLDQLLEIHPNVETARAAIGP